MSLRVLIIGYGSSGQRYFKIIKKKFPNFETKVFSKSNKKGNYFINKFSDIKNFKPHSIFFCNPSSERIKYLSLIKNVNNIFFEKPLSNTFENAKKIYAISKNKKKVVFGYNLRFLNILNLVQKKLKYFVGKVYSYDCECGSYLPYWRKENYKFSVSSQKKLGGGVLLELSHELDYINWIFGTKYDVKAFCTNSKILDLDVEDNVKIIFKHTNKILGSLSLDFLNHKKKRFFTVNGTKGVLRVDLIKNELSLFQFNTNKWRKIKFEKNDINNTYFELVDYFFNKSKKNFLSKKISQFDDALFILKTIKKIKKHDNGN